MVVAILMFLLVLVHLRGRPGRAWAAIRHDVLTRFTPAELRHAEQLKPTDSILDLVENPWEAP